MGNDEKPWQTPVTPPADDEPAEDESLDNS